MAYIYAPTIDNTVTAYDIDNVSNIDTENAESVLNIPFFLNNTIASLKRETEEEKVIVLARIEDAYGNSWFNGTSAVLAFTCEADTIVSTIYSVDTGIETRYLVQIPVPALKTQSFTTGDYCHVFLKLLGTNATLPSSESSWEQWLNTPPGVGENKDQSAWSSAGVRYFVKTPSIEFKQKQSRLWQLMGTSLDEENLIAYPDARPLIRAEFIYNDKLETDSIEWGRFHTELDNGNFDSGRIYPIAKNILEWQLPEKFSEEGNISYTYKTKKGYIGIGAERSYERQTQGTLQVPDATITASRIGRGDIGLKIVINEIWQSDNTTIIFNVERAVKDTENWEQVVQKEIAVNLLQPSQESITAIDQTCQLGVAYKYRYFWSSKHGNSSIAQEVILPDPAKGIMCISEDILLTTKDAEWVIRFNPELTGLKYNFKDAITPTLGKRYPFIYRNRKQNYKTFTLGGMISYEAQPQSAYLAAVPESASPHEKQIILERIFRDNLLQFLEAGNVILFRSLQEGNMFIHLSNIQLKSEKALGRMIYSFSATATEVCEANSDNYLKYFADAGIDAAVEARILYAQGTVASEVNQGYNVQTLTNAEGESVETPNGAAAEWWLYHTTIQE